jgi:hypothetical protein
VPELYQMPGRQIRALKVVYAVSITELNFYDRSVNAKLTYPMEAHPPGHTAANIRASVLICR